MADARRAGVRAMIEPRSIAIIGAGPDTNKLSGRPQHFLMRDGYAGRIYPVNPKYAEINGLTCYPDVAALPEAPDMAIVAVAAKRAVGVVADLGEKGCPVAVLFSAGFGELGAEGRALEDELVTTARANGIRLCGPNTLGLVNAFANMSATFSQYADITPVPGPIGFASQSGAFGTAIAAVARSRGLGLGYFLSTGNTVDITPFECLAEIIEDDRIRVAAGYVEGVSDGNELIALARRALELRKPLLITKVGRHAAGARAAQSHTGTLAGEDRVFDAVARQAGVLRARNEEHLLDMATALVANPAADGSGLAIITQSGGAGVLMADRAEDLGLAVPVLTQETRDELAKVLPLFGATGNPIDVTGQFLTDPQLLGETARIVMADPQIDVAVIWLQLMHGYADTLVKLFCEIKAEATKPFVVCWVEVPDAARTALIEADIAVLSGTERTVDAAAALVDWGAALRKASVDSGALHAEGAPATASGDRDTGVVTVPAIEAAALLRAFGIPLVDARIASNASEAAEVAGAVGYPVALKIESPDIAHKTEAGGVRLGLTSAAAVREAAEQILGSAREFAPDAEISGILVQAMAQPATEIVLGLRRDATFGPIVMVGLGGVFVEILEDVAFLRAPFSEDCALDAIARLKGAAILNGARGRPVVDRQALARAMVALSQLALAHPQIEELDLNPVFAGPDGVVAVDWLMTRRG